MEYVTMLIPDETVRLNQERLDDLRANMGAAAVENVMCRALEELVQRLSCVEQYHREARLPEMRKSARSLVALADQIGMQLLARVARDVTIALDNDDTVAVAATLLRLLRIGDASLSEAWQMRGLSL